MDNKTVSNMVFSLYTKYSGARKMLQIFFLLSILIEIQAAQECDFVKCVAGVRVYIFDLSLNKGSFTCKKLYNIPSCSEHCMQKYFPIAFSHSKEGQLSFSKYCEENISSRLNENRTCIARHIYRLFTCLANVNSLTANNVREDVPTESCSSCLCRKYLEFQNCPKQVLLADCGKESSDVVRDLIVFILDNYLPVSCKGANIKEVLSMPISYHLGSGIVNSAKSLDDHHVIVHTCLNQLIQDEIDLDGYMCGDYNPDLDDCVNYELIKNGKPHPDVKRLLMKIIALSGFKCKHSTYKPETISSSHSDEPEKILLDDHQSLKDTTVFDKFGLSTSKDDKNDNDDPKFTPKSFTYAEEEKFEIPMNDHLDISKNIKAFNVSNSINKKSKKHLNEKVNVSNASSRINLSVNFLIFNYIFLLFIFR